MSRIGIITFHFADNFGAVLQAFALTEVVSNFDNSVEIIDFRPESIRETYEIYFDVRKSVLENGLRKTIKRGLSNIFKYKIINKRISNFDLFRKQYLKLSNDSYYLPDELYICETNYDYIITGSDQVWNPNITGEHFCIYLLDFAKESVKRVSYAPSIAQNICKDELQCISNSLNQFDFISVRERSAKKILENATDKKISVVLDPTLLLSNEAWGEFLSESKEKDKYILVYDLVKNDVIVSLSNKIVQEKGWKIVSYSNKKGYKNWKSSFFSANPLDFLTLLKNAEFVITSSFHGTAFAVIFNKPFYTVPHPTRGSRMIDFVTELGMGDRIIRGSSDIVNLNENIDYDRVNGELKKMRYRSIEFLKESLSHGVGNED